MVTAGITTLCLQVVIVLNFNLILSLRLHSLSSTTIRYSRNLIRDGESYTASESRRSVALHCVNANDQKNMAITVSDADLMAKITAAAEDNVSMRCSICLLFHFCIRSFDRITCPNFFYWPVFPIMFCRWSLEDDKILYDGAEAKIPLEELCISLKRGYQGVKARLNHLNNPKHKAYKRFFGTLEGIWQKDCACSFPLRNDMSNQHLSNLLILWLWRFCTSGVWNVHTARCPIVNVTTFSLLSKFYVDING